jgi:hypothetical protein
LEECREQDWRNVENRTWPSVEIRCNFILYHVYAKTYIILL